MLLDVKRQFFSRSERVKSLDFHPTEPWVVAGLYNGTVVIYNTITNASVKTFEVTDVPVRCVRFISRKNWFVAGSDDYQLRCFNYNTSEKIAAFEAHPDYIRSLAVHPTQPYVITGSDDMSIKLWNWEKSWRCQQVFQGHTHYIMNIVFNPKDTNSFASACLDRTVKVWSLGSPHANFTLEAHDKGVNYVEYYHGNDKPYIVTTGDDRLVKVWDYHSKSLVQSMEGHTSNVSFAIFHPSLPLIISGAEDGTVKIWNSNTYRLEQTLNYGLERAWSIAYSKSINDVAVGFDEGSVVFKLGREEPTFSMDTSGKVIFARNSEIYGTNLQTIEQSDLVDGQRIPSQARELGSTEVFPQSIEHSPNGRFVTVCGDGEYIIYTALAWRNKAFGLGTSFAWAGDSNTYAVREPSGKLRMFKNFKEKNAPTVANSMGGITNVYGGTLLGVQGPGWILFCDWETGNVVRRIDVDVTNVSWSPAGDVVAIVAEDSVYMLNFNREAYDEFVASGGDLGDEGVEDAFEVVSEITDSVSTCKWLGDCFVYISTTNRLCYVLGEQSQPLNNFDGPQYLLGYISTQNRVYVIDKDLQIRSYALAKSLIEYQLAILTGDHASAEAILPSIPSDQKNRVARFLEEQGLKELAMTVATDTDQKFELAVELGKLDEANELAKETPNVDAQNKWRTLGDKALEGWDINLAVDCYKKANDLEALLLIYTSNASKEGLAELAALATKNGQHNIAFAALLQLGSPGECVDCLMRTERFAEAALFASTYARDRIQECTMAWKNSLFSDKKDKIAKSIAEPQEQPELFNNLIDVE
ncbi:Coatomer, beta' subunit [Wallemia mellicola]|uniref:Coatomer subunit beta' n=1 Tax=Wallemia mellicola TaxID=1708541 RepID=A0A4T0MIU5_9BASI|nr:Coatomer, beta' subunit [Wallemia mellicola]TIB82818.1 Coatomer, beta' subunit [Wallemia mellicola]TIB85461.1 Coatomer, beta' subunit [Wallemia mellicola]TIB97839.1 Coatomer, beta' subunit [Wallemia mellicola]TIB98599.1 Coatomer, beta' subunit [Wallemia mellicola]